MNILDALRARALERREQYDTHLVDLLPSTAEIGRMHIPGTYSLVVPETFERFLKRGKLIDLGGVREAPTTIARDYLTVREFKAARLRGGVKDLLWQVLARQPAMPYYARPAHASDGFYLDIRKCFFEIMHIVGWNVVYAPGLYLLRGEAPDDFPFPEHPISRNSLVTCSTSRELFALAPPHWQPQRLARFNPLLNSSLNALIRDVLHSIAHLAIKAGAIYCNTDGYICPDYASAQQTAQIIEDFGLHFHVRSRGYTRVHGIGNYTVGKLSTKFVGTRESQSTRAVHDLAYAKWLAPRFAALAASNGNLNIRSDQL